MVITASQPDVDTQIYGEKRVTLHSLNWDAYQQILHALNEGRSTRLTYDRGTLEITMPSEAHEFAAELIGLFIRILVGEMGLELKSMRSTTLQRPDLDRSPEPDNAYYIQSHHKVAAKTIDLTQDPPPDLVVEIDITHTDIDKLQLYANLGVPEFWRYNGQIWRIYQLHDGSYQELEISPTFPFVSKQKLYDFLTEAQRSEIKAEQALRTWAKNQYGLSNPG